MPGGRVCHLSCRMDSGKENQDLHSLSIQSPTDQPPVQQNSLEERSSDVEEKPLQGKGRTSSQLTESSAQRGEAESCSSQESSRKRKRGPRHSPCHRAEPSRGEEGSEILERRGRSSGAGHSSCSREPGDAGPSRAQRQRQGHGKRPRSRPREDQPPPLRKCLVSSLLAMSEATYHTIAQMRNLQAAAPLGWEHYALLAQLRGQLHAQVYTPYALANQAAYGFPAEEWLVPVPLPGHWGPESDGGQAHSPS